MKTIQSIVLRVASAIMLFMVIALPAFALDLKTARLNGVAGEVDNGLLAIPPGAPVDAEELIATINNSRRAEYAKVAAQNNLAIEVVGEMMFQKIYSRLPAGTWVKVQGRWIKKEK
jgi:uncharacterized protein YdbL (DUF1318 family)